MAVADPNQEQLLSARFNHDTTCFTVGTSHGFYVHRCDPYNVRYHRKLVRQDQRYGGVAIAELLQSSNILALVGGGCLPAFPPNQVHIWKDDNVVGKQVIGTLEFTPAVSDVCFRSRFLIIGVPDYIYVYSFPDLEHQYTMHTNDSCPCAFDCSVQLPFRLVCGGPKERTLQVTALIGFDDSVTINLPGSYTTDTVAETYSLVRLNRTASHVAAATSNGQLVRIFNTSNGHFVRELFRGLDTTHINTLDFCSPYITACSEKGTVHVWDVLGTRNQRSLLRGIGSVVSTYFDAEWAFIRFPVPVEGKTAVVAFAGRDVMYMIQMNGHFYRFRLDVSAQVATQERFNVYFPCQFRFYHHNVNE